MCPCTTDFGLPLFQLLLFRITYGTGYPPRSPLSLFLDSLICSHFLGGLVPVSGATPSLHHSALSLDLQPGLYPNSSCTCVLHLCACVHHRLSSHPCTPAYVSISASAFIPSPLCECPSAPHPSSLLLYVRVHQYVSGHLSITRLCLSCLCTAGSSPPRSQVPDVPTACISQSHPVPRLLIALSGSSQYSSCRPLPHWPAWQPSALDWRCSDLRGVDSACLPGVSLPL